MGDLDLNASVLLLLAIVAVLGFVAGNFFGRNHEEKKDTKKKPKNVDSGHDEEDPGSCSSCRSKTGRAWRIYKACIFKWKNGSV